MDTKPDDADTPIRNVMEQLLQQVRETYVREHGTEPSEEFMQEARREIVLRAGKLKRDEHREIYDALADE